MVATISCMIFNEVTHTCMGIYLIDLYAYTEQRGVTSKFLNCLD